MTTLASLLHVENLKNILLILLSVSLNATAQMLMRAGMLRIGKVGNTPEAILSAAPQMITNLFLWGAIAAYGVSVVLWMVVLSKVEVSFAYAFLSIGFMLVTILSYLIFKDNITPLRIVGILLICGGVFCVAQTGNNHKDAVPAAMPAAATPAESAPSAPR
jgi:multidrug transporter EmrE-like cation transporter